MHGPSRETIERFRQIDIGLGRHAEKASRALWPWSERLLIILTLSVAALDFSSTFLVIGLIEKKGVYEAGLIASWALERGGFALLLATDAAVTSALCAAACLARFLYDRRGFTGYGRAAFVFLLAPYVVLAALAALNNLSNLFR